MPVPHTVGSSSLWVLVLASAASCMAALDTLVVTTALTTLRLDLGASIDQLEWTVNGYNLSFAVLLMTAAALGDRLGRRRMFAAGLALFAVASAACALAPSIGWLIAARVRAGRGRRADHDAGVHARQRRLRAGAARLRARDLLLAHRPRGRQRPARSAAPSPRGSRGSGSSGSTSRSGSRSCRSRSPRMPESFGPDSALDVRGLALVTRRRARARVGPRARQRRRLGQPRGRRGARGGALLLAAFVAWELRARAPMLPMRFFRSRAFSAGNAAIFFAVGSLFSRRLLPRAVHADRARLGPARTPGCGCCRGRRRCSSWPRSPARSSTAIGERPFLIAGPLLQAVGMGWIALVADAGHGLRRAGRAADRGRRRHLDVLPGGPELGGRLGAARGDRQGRRHQQHDARARRRVRHRGRGRRVRRRRQLRLRRPRSATASSRRSPSRPACRCSARSAGPPCRAAAPPAPLRRRVRVLLPRSDAVGLRMPSSSASR